MNVISINTKRTSRERGKVTGRLSELKRKQSKLSSRTAVGKQVRAAAKGQPCTARLVGCNGNTDTTVLAHVRTPGTGIGRKPLDTMALFACSDCHDRLDGRQRIKGMMEKEIQERIIFGMAETHEILDSKELLVAK
jgi:hypothetical protein